MALGCPERASDPDLRATFEDGDHHHVRDADTADEQGHGDRGAVTLRECFRLDHRMTAIGFIVTRFIA